MIRKNVKRFSEKIMPKQEAIAGIAARSDFWDEQGPFRRHEGESDNG